MNFFGFGDQEDEEKKIKEISSYWEEEDTVKDGHKKWTQEELDALDVISRAFVRIINFRRFVRRMKRDREEYFSENARKIQAIMRMKLGYNQLLDSHICDRFPIHICSYFHFIFGGFW